MSDRLAYAEAVYLYRRNPARYCLGARWHT